MARRIITQTYDLTGGATDVIITGLAGVSKLSYHLRGDAAVDGTATIKLQESNVSLLGLKDVSGATAIANVSTDEYVGSFDVFGAFISFNVVIGTATAGIITLELRVE